MYLKKKREVKNKERNFDLVKLKRRINYAKEWTTGFYIKLSRKQVEDSVFEIIRRL